MYLSYQVAEDITMSRAEKEPPFVRNRLLSSAFFFANGGANMQTSLQKLSPYIDDFQCRIRREKDAKGFTINTLADAAGVPVTAVGRINAGTQTSLRSGAL